MEDHDVPCRRCGRELRPTPAGVQELPWWDGARVRAQGWVGERPGEAVGMECLTADESNVLLPAPRRAGRFTRDARPVRREAPA